jgi:hypothetical protein
MRTQSVREGSKNSVSKVSEKYGTDGVSRHADSSFLTNHSKKGNKTQTCPRSSSSATAAESPFLIASRHCSARSPFQSMFIFGADDEDDADEEADDAEPRKVGRLAAAAGLGLAAAAAAAATGGWLPLEAGRETSLSSAGSSCRRSRDGWNVVRTNKSIKLVKT